MKSKVQAGTLLQGPELSRMQRRFKGKVKWIRTFPDDAYLVLFMDGSKLYRPSRTWLKLHSQWAQLKLQMPRFTNRKVSILWHESVKTIPLWKGRVRMQPDNRNVEVISQSVEHIPLPIWNGVDKFWNAIFPFKQGEN
jgi:hypothetical protein